MPDSHKPEGYPILYTHVNYTDLPREYRLMPSESSGLRKPPNAVTAAYVALPEGLYIAFAYTSSKDKFSRKIGRELATSRLTSLFSKSLSQEDASKYARLFPMLKGEVLEQYIRESLSRLALKPTSETGKVIAQAIRDMYPSEHTEKYITDLVREQIYDEFGPDFNEIMRRGKY